jgi:hypothetical protein
MIGNNMPVEKNNLGKMADEGVEAVQMEDISHVKTGWLPSAVVQMRADHLRYRGDMLIANWSRSKVTILEEESVRFEYK